MESITILKLFYVNFTEKLVCLNTVEVPLMTSAPFSYNRT